MGRPICMSAKPQWRHVVGTVTFVHTVSYVGAGTLWHKHACLHTGYTSVTSQCCIVKTKTRLFAYPLYPGPASLGMPVPTRSSSASLWWLWRACLLIGHVPGSPRSIMGPPVQRPVIITQYWNNNPGPSLASSAHTCCFSEPPQGGTGMPVCARAVPRYCRLWHGNACLRAYQCCNAAV